MAGRPCQTGRRSRTAALDRPAAGHFARTTCLLAPGLWARAHALGATDLLLSGVKTDARLVAAAVAAFDLGPSVWVRPGLVASTYGETGQATGLGVLAKVLGRGRLVALGAARARVLAG